MPERAQRSEGLPRLGRELLARQATGGGFDPPVTPRKMLERGFEYHAYCKVCDESRRVDLQRLLRIGQGDRSLIGRRLKCRRCGQEGSGRARFQFLGSNDDAPRPQSLRAVRSWLR